MKVLFLINAKNDMFGDMVVDYEKLHANENNRYPQLVPDMMDIVRQHPEKKRKPKPPKKRRIMN